MKFSKRGRSRDQEQEQIAGAGFLLLLIPAPAPFRYRTELVVAGAGPGGIFSCRYRVISSNKCRDVPCPSEIECERFGYENVENCLFAAIRALINASVP